MVSHHGNQYGLCTMRSVVKERFKYVYYPYDIAELYDRDKDPWELDNRIDDPDLADVRSEMHALLIRHLRECGDLFNIGAGISGARVRPPEFGAEGPNSQADAQNRP